MDKHEKVVRQNLFLQGVNVGLAVAVAILAAKRLIRRVGVRGNPTTVN